MLHVADHYFYQALAHAARRQSPRLVARAAARFRKWAAGCPDNFLHKLKVIEGERLRASGRLDEAAAAFTSAAEAARQYGYLHVEALAADLEGRALAAAGRTTEAEHARARSTATYRRWGATSLGGTSLEQR